jgi:hypothetical protein
MIATSYTCIPVRDELAAGARAGRSIRQCGFDKTDPTQPSQARVPRTVLTKRTHFPLDARAKWTRFCKTNPIFAVSGPQSRHREHDGKLRTTPRATHIPSSRDSRERCQNMITLRIRAS